MSGLEQLYQQVILDHARNPAHFGELAERDAEVHHVNPTCGDEVTVSVRLEGRDDAAVLADIGWVGTGCSISQASTSVMSELVDGVSVTRAFELADEFRELMGSRGESDGDEESLQDAVAFAGVSKYPARVKCALLGWMAMKDAVLQAMAADEEKENHS